MSETRICRGCARPFAISDGEIEFLHARAAEAAEPWFMPARCLGCRKARRAAKYTEPVIDNIADEWIECIECGAPFQFGGRDRTYYASRGFAKPKRCRDCRTERSA